MSVDYKGVKVPEYADHADGPQAFKDLVDGVLPLAGGTVTGNLTTTALTTKGVLTVNGRFVVDDLGRAIADVIFRSDAQGAVVFENKAGRRGKGSHRFVIVRDQTAQTLGFHSDDHGGRVISIGDGVIGIKAAGYFNVESGLLNIYRPLTTAAAANTVLSSLTAGGFGAPGERHLVMKSTSARKYKSQIKPAPQLADLTLNPVTFHHDDDDADYIGFIADDVGEQDTRAGIYQGGEIDNYDLRAVVAIVAAKVNRLEGASA